MAVPAVRPVARPAVEVRFDTASTRPDGASAGWLPATGSGVDGLAVEGGLLVGRAVTDFPVIDLERTGSMGESDDLHSVVIRLRVSAGHHVAVGFLATPHPDLPQVVAMGRVFPWLIASPFVALGVMQTYVLPAAASPSPIGTAASRHVLIRPTDVPGATFEIESVRLVFQREMLAAIPSGVSWQGLSEIYHETLVAHPPHEVSLRFRLPRERPWLDLALGTPDSQGVRFRISLRPGGGDGRQAVVLDRTVTAPNRWEPAAVELSPWAGQQVTMTLAAAGPGSVGFWGSPVVRSRQAEKAQEARGHPADGPPQGVILVLADTLRRDHLDAYGYRRSTAPTLRRLAAEGVRFADCQSEATWTKASAPSILTALYPITHGVREFSDRLAPDTATLAEVYRAAGHATVAFSSMVFIGRYSGLERGFEELHEASSLPERGTSSKTAREYAGRLATWLDRHRDGPFFVLLHVLDPHQPYEPRPPYSTLFADPAGREEHLRQQAAVRRWIADPLLQALSIPARSEVVEAGFDPDAYIRYDEDWYDASIRGMDDEIGRLLAHLHALRLDGKVLVVLASDHGEEFFEHGRTAHGQSVYGEMTDVPLIFWRPGALPAGKVIDTTVENIDIAPTLLALSALPAPAGMQGRSLAPALAGNAASSLRALPTFAIKAATHDPLGPPPPDRESVAVVAGGWKLIENLRRPAGEPASELYDHRRDPLDGSDLAARHPEVVSRLARLVEDWLRRTGPRHPTRRRGGAAGVLRPEEVESLRSLGYLR